MTLTLDDMTFKFIGHLADSATNVRHGKNGTKITLEVPEDQLSEVINLPFLQGQVLKITIKPHQNEVEAYPNTEPHFQSLEREDISVAGKNGDMA